MERKYYLRGLGIGIAVTAIIMGIALSGGDKMTDSEIIARAKELGMVENTVLSNQSDEEQQSIDDINPDVQENDDSAGDDALGEQENTDYADNVVSDAQENAPETGQNITDVDDVTGESNMETDAGMDDIQDADAEEQVSDDSDEETEPDNVVAVGDARTDEKTEKVITIKSGEGSYTVSKKLADVGVISSAENFDNFLCEHGYDKRLHTGTFTIPANASDEQIARIVTGLE